MRLLLALVAPFLFFGCDSGVEPDPHHYTVAGTYEGEFRVFADTYALHVHAYEDDSSRVQGTGTYTNRDGEHLLLVRGRNDYPRLALNLIMPGERSDTVRFEGGLADGSDRMRGDLVSGEHRVGRLDLVRTARLHEPHVEPAAWARLVGPAETR